MSSEPARSLVLETCVRLVFHAVLVVALFFLFSGHSAPGGGFIGGLVAGTALVLRYLVDGDLVGVVRVHPATVLGTGLLVAAGTATAPWLAGGQVLQSWHTELHLPVLGELPVTSVLAFDTGVFLIVVGLTLAVLSTLGAQLQASLGGGAEPDGSDHRAAARPGARDVPGTPAAAEPPRDAGAGGGSGDRSGQGGPR